MPLFSKVRDIFKSTTSVKRKKVYHNVLLQDPGEFWYIKGEIGDGAFGKVYKAENISNGRLAALKKVALEEEEDLDNFMVEIDILAECQHPNIVQLLEAYHWEGCLWMYLEFCDGGAVDSIMVDLDRPLTEPQIAYLCKSLLEALDYIHKHKVIHRDIKAGNVLLTTDGGVKLADFGVSAKNKHTMDKRGTFIGTPYWLAPEVIKCETFIDSKYDYKADIWSLGITLIEFAQMDPPNHEVSPLRVLLKIQKSDPPKLDCPSKFSKEFNDFIAQCLVKEPEDRPDARDLLNHPFMTRQHSSKHIVALLIEYQADVVEEDVEDDGDHRSSRLSIDSEDQSSASQDLSVASDDFSRRHKEVTPTGVMDRRATKGPAPPPPGQQKKGLAPSAPSPATTPVTTPATTPVTAHTFVPPVTKPVTSVAASAITYKKAEVAPEKVASVAPAAPKPAAVTAATTTAAAPVAPKSVTSVASSVVVTSSTDSTRPGVVESPPSTPQDSPRYHPVLPRDEQDPSAGAPVSLDFALAEEEAVQLLDEAIDLHTSAGGNDSITSVEDASITTTGAATNITANDTSTAAAGSTDAAAVTATTAAGVTATTTTAENIPAAAPASEVVVVSGNKKEQQPQQVVISSSSILEGESNTDDVVTPNRVPEQSPPSGRPEDAAHISVVSVAEAEKQRLSADAAQLQQLLPSDTKVTIEGTTLGDTDTDAFLTSKDGVVSVSSEESEQSSPQQQRLINGRDVALHKPITEDRSDSDSVSTVSSEKENSKPRRRGSTSGEEEVQLRHPGRSNATTASLMSTSSINSISVNSISLSSDVGDASLRPIDRNRQNRQANHLRNGRTKEENDSLALRKKTRKRTRKFMIDGVVVTSTTSKVIYGDDEDGNIMTSGHLARKQELRELKILQKLEQKQFQELGIKATQARQEQERKFDSEKSQLIRSYDNDVDTLNRQQKQQVERTEALHEIELKSVSKKIRAEQEKDLRSFRESLKTELKLLKQEVDLLPKDVRKEALKNKKERLETEQAEKEKAFLERLHQNHESSMKRLSEEHRSHVALLERQFLQKKHQMLRAREAALWELEERHLHDKHQLAKRQLKDIFFLQRHQMLLRHEKELEQVRRQNAHREEELIKRQAVEKRSMPKRIRQEMKARELMFRESMRISCTNLPESHHDEKEKLRKFQDCEKRRYEAEKKRGEQKHKRQLEELVAATEAHAKELEQMQNEKRKMLMEHETLKLKAQEEEYQKDLREWKNNLKPRKQKLEEDFEQQLLEQEQFYGAYLTTSGGTLLSSSLPD